MVPDSYRIEMLSSYEDWVPRRDDFLIVHLTDFQSRAGDGLPESDLLKKVQDVGCLRLFVSGR